MKINIILSLSTSCKFILILILTLILIIISVAMSASKVRFISVITRVLIIKIQRIVKRIVIPIYPCHKLVSKLGDVSVCCTYKIAGPGLLSMNRISTDYSGRIQNSVPLMDQSCLILTSTCVVQQHTGSI